MVMVMEKTRLDGGRSLVLTGSLSSLEEWGGGGVSFAGICTLRLQTSVELTIFKLWALMAVCRRVSRRADERV